MQSNRQRKQRCRENKKEHYKPASSCRRKRCVPRILEKYKHQFEGREKGMCQSALWSPQQQPEERLARPSLSLFCFGPEIFANSGMPGILIRTRALLVVLFINPNGREGPDCALKKGKGKIKRKKNTQTQKSKPEKNKKAVLQRGSIQAVPILILSWLMENHQHLPHLNGTLSTGNVNAVTNARVCQAYQPGCETGDAPRPARTAVMDNDISRLMDGR